MNEGTETRVERLCTIVEQLVRSVDGLTEELHGTNASVSHLTTNMALVEQRVDTHGKEIYAGDNSSRIRTLELHVKGLYAVEAFICMTIGGQLLAILSHWHSTFLGVKP